MNRAISNDDLCFVTKLLSQQFFHLLLLNCDFNSEEITPYNVFSNHFNHYNWLTSYIDYNYATDKLLF